MGLGFRGSGFRALGFRVVKRFQRFSTWSTGSKSTDRVCEHDLNMRLQECLCYLSCYELVQGVPSFQRIGVCQVYCLGFL